MHPIFINVGDLLKMGKFQDFRDRVNASQVQMVQKDLWRCVAAEFLGTMLLVLIGCSSILQLDKSGPPTLVGVALAFGLSVATLAQAIGHVSGCHINPAVTIGMFVTGKIEVVKGGLYIAAQCVGAIVGSGILKALSPEEILGDFALTKVHAKLSALQGFGIEFLLTFVLVLIIFAVSDENRNDIKGSAPLAIGLALTALIIAGGPFTGASLNPARTLGPCVVSGQWGNHWVFWIGPLGGAITAATIYQHILRALKPEEIEAAELEKTKTKEPENNGGAAVV